MANSIKSSICTRLLLFVRPHFHIISRIYIVLWNSTDLIVAIEIGLPLFKDISLGVRRILHNEVLSQLDLKLVPVQVQVLVVLFQFSSKLRHFGSDSQGRRFRFFSHYRDKVGTVHLFLSCHHQSSTAVIVSSWFQCCQLIANDHDLNNQMRMYFFCDLCLV